jgi:hypothetical protein
VTLVDQASADREADALVDVPADAHCCRVCDDAQLGLR